MEILVNMRIPGPACRVCDSLWPWNLHFGKALLGDPVLQPNLGPLARVPPPLEKGALQGHETRLWRIWIWKGDGNTLGSWPWFGVMPR